MLTLLMAMAMQADAGAASRKEIMAAGLNPWMLCVRTTATKWAAQPEPADVIARGAIAQCASFEPAAQDAIKRALIAEGVGEGQALKEAREIMGNVRAAWEDRAVATVLVARNAGR